MTLSARNYFFKGGTVIAALSLTFIVVGGYLAFPAYPDAAETVFMRSGGAIMQLIGRLASPSTYVPFWTMVIAAAYSFISIILIYYFFEKTQAPEILFIGFFVISLAFEFTRIIIFYNSNKSNEK
jgi:hypothetical protein